MTERSFSIALIPPASYGLCTAAFDKTNSVRSLLRDIGQLYDSFKIQQQAL
jgi:hypothetical protein